MILDAEVVARIRRLHLVATQSVDGLMSGAHRSRRVGSAIEFADYKDYNPGDPLRHLDWRVAARTDRLVVRRYEVETELASVVVVDSSGDLSTGKASRHGRPPLEGSKHGHVVTLAACLAWFLHRHQEPVGLLVLGGAPRWLPPRGGREHIGRIFATLADLRPQGRADIGAALAQLGPRLRRRSLVALVSDLMEEPDTWVPSLAALARRRTDLACFHVLDRKEMELDFEQPALFWGPEDDERLPLDPPGAREEFHQIRDAWLAEVRGALGRHRGRYYRTWTDRPVEDVLRPMILGEAA